MIDALLLISPLSRKKQSHIVSPKNMSSTSCKWETLFVFPFFWLLLFLFLFLFSVLFLFFCIYRESSEEDEEAFEAMAEIDKFEESLKQKEIIKPE